MLRIALIQLILFALPFVIYFVYRALLARMRQEARGTFRAWPLQVLLIAGGSLTLLGLVVFALNSGEGGDTVYIPAHLENGEVVPGRFVPADEAGDLAKKDPKERARSQ